MKAQADATSAAQGSSWGWAAACSIALHIGAVLAVSWLPDGGADGSGAKRPQLFTPGAVIPIETIEHTVAQAEPSRDPIAPPLGPADPDSPNPSEPEPNTSGGDARGAATPPPEPTQAQAEPNAAPGLSLHGLRDGARATTVGAASKGVLVDPSMLQGSRTLYEDSVDDSLGAIQGPAPAASGVDYAFSREKGKLVYRDPSGRFVATLNPDGRVNFRNKGAKATWTNVGMAGPGDALMAAAGDDPYARLKAKLLKATFEMRIEMAVDFQKKQIDKRLHRLEGELDKIWADERRELSARRELLFERWDECDEPEEVEAGAELPGFGAIENSELDDARQGAAASARKRILEFIRKHAPKGSESAFTAAELSEFNRRRVSKQKFSPYE